MSETETTYGVPKTVCDTEPFPPQTGDLLGSYIARLSARVKALETAYTEQSAYQRSLETRIERLSLRVATLETLLQERYNGHDALRDTVIRIANHVGYAVHPQRETSEPTAEQYTETHDDQSHVTGPEQTAESVCTTCGHRRDDHKEYATGHGSMWACDEFTPVEPVCKCGHAEADHIEPAGIHICLGGTLGSPCMCVEYKPVASEG